MVALWIAGPTTARTPDALAINSAWQRGRAWWLGRGTVGLPETRVHARLVVSEVVGLQGSERTGSEQPRPRSAILARACARAGLAAGAPTERVVVGRAATGDPVANPRRGRQELSEVLQRDYSRSTRTLVTVRASASITV